MLKRQLKELLGDANFFQKVGGLTLATGIAQGFTLLNFFLIAKTTSPAVVGQFQVILSYMAIVASFATLSYQYSLPSISQEDSENLIVGMITILLIVAGAVFAVFSLLHVAFAYAIACLVLSNGLINMSEKTCIRDSRIIYIGSFRVALQLSFSMILVTFYFTHFSSLRTVINAYVVVSLTVAFSLAVLANWRYVLRPISPRVVIKTLVKWWKNAAFVAPSDFLNSMVYSLPTIMIASAFSNVAAAQFSIVVKFCFAPMMLLATTAGQVFHSELGLAVRQQRTDAYQRFKQVKKWFALLGVLFFFAVLVVLPFIIRILLGSEWRMAEYFAMIMSPLFGVMMFVTPLNVIFYVFNKQFFLLVSQALYLLASVVSFGIAIWIHDIYWGIALFTVLSIIRFVFVQLVIEAVAKRLKVKTAA